MSRVTGGEFLAVFGTATPPRLIDRFTWNLVCKFIRVWGNCSFSFMSLLTIFLALRPKVHFSLKYYQKEFALYPLPLSLLTCNLVCYYIGVVWLCMCIFKFLLAKFLAIWPKKHFYNFFMIIPQLIAKFFMNFGINT